MNLLAPHTHKNEYVKYSLFSIYSTFTQYLLKFTQGVMKTVQDDCQFVCITQSDYYKILNDGEANQKVIKENDQVVLVSEFDNTTKTGFKVIRGTPEKLLDQLVDENFTAETKYDEDFLLTHRTFMPSFRGLFITQIYTQCLLNVYSNLLNIFSLPKL